MTTSADTITELIKTRRSIFPPSYTDQEIPRELIEEVLESANYAPTHRLTQPWRFTVFRGEGLQKLADFFGDAYKAQTAPEAYSEAKYEGVRTKVLKSACVMAIIMDVHSDKVPEWEEVAAVACAVQNMWLTTTALGIGSYWSSPSSPARLHEFLGLNDNQKCLGFFYMGYHNAEPKPAIRKPIEEKVNWVEA
ncbi:nitroreductase [Spirosoma sp. KUDC1026]|uniref:nitroreductase family protein n=1 Tax=Spirosoma sp. KUDC1026 TaxID=2745947 RepID=UPI00159BB343|nr:nitroreductase [Spirosoma sp. KUDC1026]QKZ14914.1 nitroreductase [Spirosoma sp. KUDC1026]